MVGAAETKERERARRDRENFMLLEVAKGSVEVYGGYRDEREREGKVHQAGFWRKRERRVSTKEEKLLKMNDPHLCFIPSFEMRTFRLVTATDTFDT